MHMPMIFDGMTQLFCKRESMNILRFITGLMAGISQVGLMDFLAASMAQFIYSVLSFI